MRITLINGISGDGMHPIENRVCKTAQALGSTDVFTVRDLDIHDCCGCFSCWTKTPGECVFRDDMTQILESMVHTDLLLYVSDIKAGFVSAQTKKAMDRMIPLLLPYIRIYHKECHHVPRYDLHCSLGVLLAGNPPPDERCVQIITETYQRYALNLHADRVFVKVVAENDAEEVLAHEARRH